MGEHTVALNRKAYHEYHIEEHVEAGIALTGTEIKSIRAGKVSLQEAYARIERGEAWLIGVTIAPFAEGNRYNHEPGAIASCSSTGARSTSCSVARSRRA